MWSALLELVFPSRCASCGSAGAPFCRRCDSRVGIVTPPWCARCGRPWEEDGERCRDCPPAPIDWARAALLYDGAGRDALMALKFGGRRSVARVLAPLLAAALARAPPPLPVGFERLLACRRAVLAPVVLTWVPLGRRRRRERGYDQAELLARGVGRLAAMPVVRLLDRVIETEPQARRSAGDRRVALRGAFRSVRRVPGEVVLVDDVLTTGATAAECARVLVAAGAPRVGVLTAARSVGEGAPARCYTRGGLRIGSVVARGTLLR